MHVPTLLLALCATLSGPQDPPEKDAAWPRLTDAERLATEVIKLRKAETDEMERQARDALLEAGAMVAPSLLEALEHERQADARGRLVAVLDGVVEARHSRLLAPYFESRALPVRTWALRRAASYADAGLAEAAAAAWARVEKQGDKADPEDRYAAALCAVSTGDLGPVEVVFEHAVENWKDHRQELRAVFAALRGEAASSWLTERLHEGDRKAKAAALRLLAAGGTEKALRHLRPYLESTDNTLRVEAINACRGIVDGDPPLEKLAVFEAIELANRWKERIR